MIQSESVQHIVLPVEAVIKNNQVLQQSKYLNENFGKKLLLAAFGIGVIGFGLYYLFKGKGKGNAIVNHNNNQSINAFQYLNIYDKIKQGYKKAPLLFLKTKQIKRIPGVSYSIDIGLFQNLDKKPVSSKNPKNPFIAPFEEGIHLMDLGKDHRLLFNKFPAIKYHMLIISREFEHQSSLLTQQDFKQTLIVMKSLDGIFFYNSGKDAGGSQPHKHIQVVPSQIKQSLILEQLIIYSKKRYHQQVQNQAIIQFDKFKFVHGMILLNDGLNLEQLAKKTHEAYLKLYNQYVPGAHQNSKLCYNLIANQQFILLIPRKKQQAYGITSLNALGFTGTVMTKTVQDYNQISKYKPEDILGDITFQDAQQLQLYRKEIKN